MAAEHFYTLSLFLVDSQKEKDTHQTIANKNSVMGYL